MSNTEGFSSIEQLAGEFGISARTAYRWLRAGKIRRKREGGHTFFLIPDMGDTDKTSDGGGVSSSVIPAVRGVTKKTGGPSNSNVSSASVESLKNEIESRKLALELQRLDELERRSEEKLEKERLEAAESEAEARREETAMRIEEEKIEQQKRERIEKIRRVKSLAIPAPLMKTIPPFILSLTLDAISNGLSKLDIDVLSQDELLTHAEAIRCRVWSEYEREIRSAGVRAVFEDLDQYLHSQYNSFEERKRALREALGKSFNGNTPEEIRKEIEPWTFERFINWSVSKLSPEKRARIVQESETFTRTCGRRW